MDLIDIDFSVNSDFLLSTEHEIDDLHEKKTKSADNSLVYPESSPIKFRQITEMPTQIKNEYNQIKQTVLMPSQRCIQQINISSYSQNCSIKVGTTQILIKIAQNETNIPMTHSQKNSNAKIVCCSCKKSKCLKLYCDCFASDTFCNNCTCVNCFNKEEFKAKREQAKEIILEKNPIAFKPKVTQTRDDENRHLKGCNCKKSGCRKKYCECFQSGIKCTDCCRCITCKNKETGKRDDRSIIRKSGLGKI